MRLFKILESFPKVSQKDLVHLSALTLLLSLHSNLKFSKISQLNIESHLSLRV